MANFCESGADGYSFLTVDEGGDDFRFCSGWHDVAHYFRHGVDGPVEGGVGVRRLGWIGGTVSYKIMATGLAA